MRIQWTKWEVQSSLHHWIFEVVLVVLYSGRRCIKDSTSDLVWTIQMDHNANGSDKCTRNIHVNYEQLIHRHAGQGSSSLPR